MSRPGQLGVFVSLLVLASSGIGRGYILKDIDQCVAPPPCQCSDSDISCDRHSFSEVPQFTSFGNDIYFSRLDIYLGFNQITTLRANAFKSLNVNASDIYLRLHDNNIRTIDAEAFTGIESMVFSLSLDDNQLETLPSAIGKLTHLHSLELTGNPLKSLDNDVMTFIGRSLTTLYLDMTYFTTWPTSINSLRALKYLTINYIPFTYLPYNAFKDLYALNQLQIYYSKLSKIPSAICRLHNLRSFYFDHNSFLDVNTELFESCEQTIPSLYLLSLGHNGLTSVPSIFYSFPYMTVLSLDYNNIKFVPSSDIPFNSSIKSLSLSYNNLTRIPYGINGMLHLDSLILDYNQIVTIEENDLASFLSLRRLDLDGNPVHYIAKDSFKNNGQISSLDLDSTSLTTIPSAVLELHQLYDFSFGRNNVQCSCAMSYLKDWDVSRIEWFYGYCSDSNQPIKQFILTTLQHCLRR